MSSNFPEGVVAFQLSADIALEDFGGGICVAGDTDVDLKALVDAGSGYIATARPALIELLSSLSAFERVEDLDDVPNAALVEGHEPTADLNPLDHPGTFKVPEVLDALADATPDQIAATIALEADGKNRAGIISYEPPAPDTADGGDDDQGNATGEADTTADTGQ